MRKIVRGSKPYRTQGDREVLLVTKAAMRVAEAGGDFVRFAPDGTMYGGDERVMLAVGPMGGKVAPKTWPGVNLLASAVMEAERVVRKDIRMERLFTVDELGTIMVRGDDGIERTVSSAPQRSCPASAEMEVVKRVSNVSRKVRAKDLYALLSAVDEVLGGNDEADIEVMWDEDGVMVRVANLMTDQAVVGKVLDVEHRKE